MKSIVVVGGDIESWVRLCELLDQALTETTFSSRLHSNVSQYVLCII
jgi:hypothetical protein